MGIFFSNVFISQDPKSFESVFIFYSSTYKFFLFTDVMADSIILNSALRVKLEKVITENILCHKFICFPSE